jgi:terminase, large subunit
LYVTEVDRYATETENRRATPSNLAKLRQRTFQHTSKLIMECSPTIQVRAGSSSSTGPEARNIGRWIPCGPGSNDDDHDGQHDDAVRSFWVPTWLSELVSWEKIGEDYLRAKDLLVVGDKSLLKTWVQTSVAEPWVEEQQPAIRGNDLLSRAEEYDAEMPSGALCLVAAIDTQDLELVYFVSAIGQGKELWWLRIDGNLEHEASAVYAELEKRVLHRDWHCADGKVMRIKRACQDAGGHHAGAVYEYVKRFPQLMVGFRAVESRPRAPIWKRGKSHGERTPLLLGATTLAKDLLLNRLEIPLPGPGYIHVGTPGRGFDEGWAREMTAERKETIFGAGIQKTVWRRLSNR